MSERSAYSAIIYEIGQTDDGLVGVNVALADGEVETIHFPAGMSAGVARLLAEYCVDPHERADVRAAWRAEG